MLLGSLALIFVVPVFEFLLLDSSELCVFLAFTPEVLLTSYEFKSGLSFIIPSTETKAGSTRLSDHVFLFSSDMKV